MYSLPQRQAAVEAQSTRISRQRTPQLTYAQRLSLLDQILADPRWHQTIDLGAGLTTDGMWKQPQITIPLKACGLRGKRVLEVGTLEGGFAFLAEDEGAAEVVTHDVYRPGEGIFQPRFQLLHQYRESEVIYVQQSVYDLSPQQHGQFDVINFSGVYYHLQHPMLALERLHALLAPNGKLLVEGQFMPGDDALAMLWHEKVLEKDRTNWWTPTKRCLQEWLDATGFRFQEQPGVEPFPYQSTRGPVAVGRVVYLAWKK